MYPVTMRWPTADHEDAADVVAATFTVAWQKLDEIPAGPEATLWLYGVARNVLSNHPTPHFRQAETKVGGASLHLDDKLKAQGLCYQR